MAPKDTTAPVRELLISRNTSNRMRPIGIDGASNLIRTRWDVITLLTGTALLAMTVVPAWGMLVGYAPGLWVWLFIFLAWNGLSITAGYHRLWSHKSYEAHPLVRVMFALGGALSLQNSILEWCSNHRKHHRYVDDVDFDPYSAKRGLFYSHVGWMLKDYPATDEDYSNVRDLQRDPIIKWQFRYYWYLAFALNVCLPLVIGAALGDAIGGFLLLGVARLVISHHTTFFINSLAHAWGKQPYSDANTSKDNPLIALLTYGEGYHNFHHTFQWDYRNGIRWYHFDPTKWLIKGLSMVKLAGALKQTAPEKIEQRMVAMQKKYATERISYFKPTHTEQWIELLDAEYNQLIEMINEWSHCRQEWLQLKKASLRERWQKTELRGRLNAIESRLKQQRRQWRLLTQQFA